MKILITGQNSYIGTSFEAWAKQQNPDWIIDTIDVRGDEWKKMCFSEYDSVLHVAGIAHIKENKENELLYFKVNRDLAIDLAIKSKIDGVKQFVFLSSMSVYGIETGNISEETVCNPKSAYGKSKLEAESRILEIQDTSFIVSILRPPMVYGKDCKGNFNALVKYVSLIPFFPRISNERSMIYIDNLSNFIQLVISKGLSGILFPQNEEYVNTSLLVNKIAVTKGKACFIIPGFRWILEFAARYSSLFSKVFGSLTYSKELSSSYEGYQVASFTESIKRSL